MDDIQIEKPVTSGLGETFGEELREVFSGREVSLSFGSDGISSGYNQLDLADRKIVDTVITNHNPNRKEKRKIGEFREFMDLFTDEEQETIALATQTNARIKLWYDKAMGGATMSLKHPTVNEGLKFMVSVGMLTNERRKEIIQSDFNNPKGES